MSGERSADPTGGYRLSGQSMGHVVQSGRIDQVHFHLPAFPPGSAGPPGSGTAQPAGTVGPPRQLPSVTALFTGRAADGRWLDEQWRAAGEAGTGVLLVVSGIAGVGKSTLAQAWLHAHAADFPDGQLYADLAGYALPDPIEPSDVLGGFLRALGVAPDLVPARLAERVALLRTATHGRRVCLMLDNARSAAEVRVLAVTAPGCATVVTTRGSISGLAMDGARMLRLEPWRTDTGIEFIGRALGADRLAREPEAARRVAELCGGLPLALGVAAAKLASRPRWTIEQLAHALARDGARLEYLDIGTDNAVLPALDGSYRVLEPEQARLYRALGRCPVLWFDAETMAAVFDRGEEGVEPLIEALVYANLIEELGDRFRFHDLIRLHAAHCADAADAADAPGESDEALGRLLDFYLASATAAEELMTPSHRILERDYRFSAGRRAAFDGENEALAWLDRQRPNLVAVLRHCARRGMHKPVWQLTDAMWPLFLRLRHTEDRLETQTLAVEAAHADGDEAAEGSLLLALSSTLASTGRQSDAAGYCDRAMELYQRLGQPRGLAQACNGRAKIHSWMHEWDAAERLFQRSLELRESIGYRRGAALAYRGLGRVAAARGDLERAEGFLRRSHEDLRVEGDRYDAAWSQALRALVVAGRGEIGRAQGLLAEAYDGMEATGSAAGRAGLLEIDGRIHEAAGEGASAEECYRRSAELFGSSDPRAASRVAMRIAGTITYRANPVAVPGVEL